MLPAQRSTGEGLSQPFEIDLKAQLLEFRRHRLNSDLATLAERLRRGEQGGMILANKMTEEMNFAIGPLGRKLNAINEFDSEKIRLPASDRQR
jgi:hypothetical protein